MEKFKKSFLLYGNKNYLPLIKKTIKSIRSFSDLPIFVYLLNYNEIIDEKNVFVKYLSCNIRKSDTLYEVNDDGSYYIDRNQIEIYDTLIQRPSITRHVLENYSETVCYLDADTICLPNLEKIFDLYPIDETVPYFTKGVYDFMYWDGVGNTGDDLTKTLEHPICELYNIDQSFRFNSGYRQTGYYVAGQNTIPFINEWIEMCNNPIIKNDTVKYAAYHEETIANCLLWKYKISKGLPNVYVNGTLETIDLINDKTTFKGEPNLIKDWLLVPSKREELFFIHGEKRLNIIDKMIEKLKGLYYKDKKIADVGYVINLPHRTDRKESVIKLLNELEITGYEFIDGVILENPEYKKMGCNAAYVNLFSKFLSSDAQNVIVFEDDIKLMNGVSKDEIDAIFDNWEETVSNYDVVGLGVKLLPRSEIKLKGKTHGSFEEMLCTQSLFYKRHFVEHWMTIMTEFLTPSSPFYKCAVDMFLNDCSSETYRFIHNERHKKFNFGITVPMLFTQGPSFSDSEGRDQDYEDNMEMAFWESLNKNKKNKKMKLLYVTPHLSTGGMPQFLLKRIQELQKYKDEVEIFLVEFCLFSGTYIVQRNQILELFDKNHFFNLSVIGEEKESEKKERLINIIKDNNIDIVHFEEITEGFESFNRVSKSLLNQIFSNDRTWKIVESCHNIWFNPNDRKLHPDAYSLVTPFHLKETFKNEQSYKELHLYPIDDMVSEIKQKNEIFNDEHRVPTIEKINKRQELGLDLFKTHILNVGLWTAGKNQGEGVEIARNLWEKNKDVHFHFLGNQAPNFEDYWFPIMQNLPPNVTVWFERNDVDNFMRACDVLMFNSTWECNPLVIREAASYGMKIMARNLPQYMGMFDGYITEIDNNDTIDLKANKLLSLIQNKETYKLREKFDLGGDLVKFYKKVLELDFIKNEELKNDYNILNHYIVNPYLQINGQTDNKLNIKFFDNNQLVYNNDLNINSWIKMNKQYYTNWRVEIRENGELIYTNTNNYKGKRVFISFGSKSLGDTLAWFPYVEEFRKKHECDVIVSTFLNYLFKEQYPNIEFVEPGSVVNNIVAQYNIGWYYTNENGEETWNRHTHPVDFKMIPLQQTASDILGFEYKEIRPKLNLPKVEKKKKVGIGIHSTCQAKYWNNPNGWQEVVDYLNNLGYECMIYSKEGDGYMGNKHPQGTTKFKGGSVQDVINDLATCEFFIGLGSGLSWLAWACELPVVLISGFSEKWAETTLDTYRVINENVCHGCFNWDRLDAGDWNWCPKHKGTEKQFECTKEITSNMVIEQINKIINKEKSNVPSDFDWGWMNTDMLHASFHKRAITEEIFDNNIYEKYFEVNEGDLVVDIGSSIGPFTKSILPKNPKHVFCLEPSEIEFRTLINNTIGNPVTQINKGISSIVGVVESDQIFGEGKIMETLTFKKFVDLYNIKKIDFLKTDCEGGEYDIFVEENIDFIKNNVRKIAGEWHLNTQDFKSKFRNFRDNILTKFDNYEVNSIDGVDIKWDLFNEHFLEYYNEVIVYINNRKLPIST
jgi:autotransporter strand-loop-strand O-heptosyltransferase